MDRNADFDSFVQPSKYRFEKFSGTSTTFEFVHLELRGEPQVQADRDKPSAEPHGPVGDEDRS